MHRSGLRSSTQWRAIMSNLLLDNNDLLWIKAVAGIDTAEAKRHFDNILSVGQAFRILNTLTAAQAKLAAINNLPKEAHTVNSVLYVKWSYIKAILEKDDE